jgi:alpha-tubulin suppressor-like RCC1 family protein
MTYYTSSDKDESFNNRHYIRRDLVSAYLQTTNTNLWAVGPNDTYQLGDGSTTGRSSPIFVPGGYNLQEIVSNDNTNIGIHSNGSLIGWGAGTFGILALNVITNKSSPTSISGFNWKAVAIGGDHVLAIKSDGTLWAWGKNDYGQLGKGNLIYYSSPVQVGSLTTWQSVACGASHSLGLTTAGTAYSWGRNNFGQLALGDVVTRSSPVQIGTGATRIWASAITSYFEANGNLYGCGNGSFGQLGNSIAGDRSVNVQITSDPFESLYPINWSCFGLRNGALYAWGWNEQGQLGLGDVNHRSSPVQVGSLTDWLSSYSSPDGVTGYPIKFIKHDGTLWAWGDNTNGDLGLGDTIHRSSPVQVGSLTDWYKVSLSCMLKIT